jgi:plastocyanin
MSTPMVFTRRLRPYQRPTLRTITLGALLANALLFGFDAISNGLNDINITHMIISFLVAGIVAIRLRWVPLLGALLCALQLVEGSIFLGSMLTEPDSAATFSFAALFFSISIIGMLAGAGATVQSYRAPRSRPLVDPAAPAWIFPAILGLSALVLGAILAIAIQPHGVLPSFSPEAVATLPALTAKDYLFEQTRISAKVGETVVLRLDNADSTTHHLDIDEFNVHALMPAGKSNVALFKPTHPGTYTFYCHPHADKAAGTGMVGTLVVEP